jgi:hypothetical protein
MGRLTSFHQTPRDEVQALLVVKPEYLTAAFDAIRQEYGTIEDLPRFGGEIEVGFPF